MADPSRPSPSTSPFRAPEDTALAADVVRELRRFHRTGEGAGAPGAPLPPALAGFRGATVRGDYPVFVAVGDDGEIVCRPVAALLEELAPTEPKALADNLLRLEREVRARVAAAAGAATARDVLAAAGAAVKREIRLPEAEAEGFAAGLDALVDALPVAGRFVSFGPQAPLALLAAAVAARQEGARAAFLAEAGGLVATADALLATDRATAEGRSGAALESSLGGFGSRFVKASELAAVGDSRRGGTGLSAPRREALEAARAALAAFADRAPAPCLVRGGEAPAEEGWRVVAADDPAATAIAVWDEEVASLLALVRARHRVRLEADGSFDPARHEPWLEHLGASDLGDEELALVTPVVAAIRGEALVAALPTVSQLLLSGRPIQVFVEVDPAQTDTKDTIGGTRFETAFLGVAHRETFVQQGSVARPEALVDGFRRALAGSRPGLHVVAGAPAATAGLDPWLLASAAIEGRAHPLFVYDPGAGRSWARRLDVAANPQPEATWAVHPVAIGAGSKTSTLEIAFTAADVLALAAPAASRLAEGNADELVPLAAWIELDPTEASRRLPFLWGVDGHGRLGRFVVTLPLALAARDRFAFWRLLQELAGIHNEHVEEARRAAREAAAEVAAEERRKLETEHAAELDRVRTEAAEEAVNRLVAAIFELESGELAELGGPSVAALGLPADVDGLAAALLEAVKAPEAEPLPDVPLDPRVAKLAGELLAAVEDDGEGSAAN